MNFSARTIPENQNFSTELHVTSPFKYICNDKENVKTTDIYLLTRFFDSIRLTTSKQYNESR